MLYESFQVLVLHESDKWRRRRVRKNLSSLIFPNWWSQKFSFLFSFFGSAPSGSESSFSSKTSWDKLNMTNCEYPTKKWIQTTESQENTPEKFNIPRKHKVLRMIGRCFLHNLAAFSATHDQIDKSGQMNDCVQQPLWVWKSGSHFPRNKQELSKEDTPFKCFQLHKPQKQKYAHPNQNGKESSREFRTQKLKPRNLTGFEH